MTENIIENNKMIAEFMGWKVPKWNSVNEYETPHTQEKWITTGISAGQETVSDFKTEEMNFTTSWDWLMPVVEKIDNIKGFTLKSFTLEAHENDNDKKEYCCILEGTPIFESYSFKSSIDAVYSAIIKFITWYNQDTKSKSKACSEVLQLMDSDFEYKEALTKVLSDNKKLSKPELEKELTLYI